jgi:tetratricopeptide (TPR) repeat protein
MGGVSEPSLNTAQTLSTAHAAVRAGRLVEADTLYREILARDPGCAEAAHAHFNLGLVLRERGMPEAAITHYIKAIALAPEDAVIHSNLGRLLAELGRIGEARAAFEKAVALSPRCGAHYLNLVYCDRVAADDAHLPAMEKLVQDQNGLREQDRIDLDFALGKACADIGQHARSFEYLLRGNARKRKLLIYDEGAALGELERIARVFDAKRVRKGKRLGNPSYRPVFIVGMPRSGTSLIEQILASHPRVFGAGELAAFQNVVAGLQRGDYGALPFPELILNLPGHRFRELGQRYLEVVMPLAQAAARITDKMPGNFRFAGLIHLALPNARIIHVQRDPIDTCLSCFSIQFTAGGSEYSYDLGELGRCYRAYATLMAHWRNVLPAGVMIDVQYEDLVDNPGREARRLLAHCGLEWDERCLSFTGTARPVRTASAAQVRRPIFQSSVGRWRPDTALLQPLLDGLNAPNSPLLAPRKTGLV